VNPIRRGEIIEELAFGVKVLHSVNRNSNPALKGVAHVNQGVDSSLLLEAREVRQRENCTKKVPAWKFGTSLSYDSVSNGFGQTIKGLLEKRHFGGNRDQRKDPYAGRVKRALKKKRESMVGNICLSYGNIWGLELNNKQGGAGTERRGRNTEGKET